MKKQLITLIFLLAAIHVKAAELRTVRIENTTLFYYFSSTPNEKKGLLVFLHGAVSQYKNLTESKSVSYEILLENNLSFLSTFNNDGYDVIMPIAYNEFNWLENKGKVFTDTLISMYKANYPEIYLSGFSDGGTGVYKFFYSTPGMYDGAIIFNGFPQHNNYSKKVDYIKITGKKVFFVSQTSDKVIPYEFLLTEYRRQKMTNPETYFFLRKGTHRFNEYTRADFEKCLSLLNDTVSQRKANADSVLVYPPVDGLIIDNKLVHLYPFRANAVKKYGMGKAEYQRSDYAYADLNKMMGEAPINFYPALVAKEALTTSDKIEFTYEYKGNMHRILLNNYLKTKAFP